MITVGGKASFYRHLKWLWASGETSETKGGKEEHWWFPFVQLCKSRLVSGEILWETQPTARHPPWADPTPFTEQESSLELGQEEMHIHLAGSLVQLMCEDALNQPFQPWEQKSRKKSKVQPIFETPHLWGCLAQALSFQFPREKRSWSAWKSSLFRATPELILPSRGDGGIFCGLQQPLEARFFYKRGAGKQRQRHATRCWTASSVSLGKPAQLTVDHEHPKLHRLVTRFLGWQILPSWSHCTVRSYYTYLSFS